MISLSIAHYDVLRNTCDILHVCKLNYNEDQQDVHVYRITYECNDFLTVDKPGHIIKISAPFKELSFQFTSCQNIVVL